jgi:hypothetical protein
MHLELMLVGLCAFAAAMPLHKKSDDSINQAQETNYKEYADYHPYYHYGDYTSPAEAEAAKNQPGTFSSSTFPYQKTLLIPPPKTAAPNTKRDGSQPVVESYTDYGAYYIGYGEYASPSDAEVAKIDMKKRGYTCYDHYAPDSAAAAAEAAAETVTMVKRGYSCYESYSNYPAAAQGEAAKMVKRHMVSMPKEMTDSLASSEKRDEPKEVEAAKDTWYKSYE